MSRTPPATRWIALASLLAIGVAVAATLATRTRRAEPIATDGPAQPESVGPTPAGALAPPVPGSAIPARELVSANQEARAAREPMAPTDLVARVVDVSGAPLEGVPVLLTPKPRHDGHTPGGWSRGVSNADGRVVFDGARARLLERFAAARTGGEPCEPWSLQHDVAFEQPPAVELTEARLARELVESVQPPFGALEVRVFELDGRPAQQIERVELVLVLPGEAEDPSMGRSRNRISAEFDGERALFACVEPARELIARAVRAGADFHSEARGLGPPRTGSRARLDVRMGSDRPFLLFRALDETGQPLADAELQAELRHDLYNAPGQRVRTDADARLRLELSFELAAMLRAELELATVDDAAPRRLGTWSEWPELENGPNDCGDVRLAPERLVVAGRVVDEGGRAVAGAVVRCGDKADYDDQRPRWHRPDPSRETQSDAEGRFALRGVADSVPRKVWAYQPGLAPSVVPGVSAMSPPAEFTKGAEDVELRLRATCRPSLRVLLPEVPLADVWSSLAHQGLALKLVRVGEPAGELQLQSTSAGPDALHLQFHPAWPGSYELTCSLHGEPLPTVPSLTLEADGSLGELDLRSLFFIHALRLHIDGDANLLATLKVRPTGSEADWTSRSVAGPVVLIATTATAVDVELLPEGFAAERVDNLSGLRELRLRAPLRVRLVLVTDGPLPGAPYAFEPELALEESSVGRAEGSACFTESKREAVFLLPRAGAVTVRWQLEKQLDNASFVGQVLYGYELEIEVEDVPGEQRIELHLPGSALRGLVANPPF